jgi:hypothetical protein
MILNRNVAPNFLDKQFLYYRYISPFGFVRKEERERPSPLPQISEIKEDLEENML